MKQPYIFSMNVDYIMNQYEKITQNMVTFIVTTHMCSASPTGMYCLQPCFGSDTHIETRIHWMEPLFSLKGQTRKAKVGVEGVRLRVHPLCKAPSHCILGPENKLSAGIIISHMKQVQEAEGCSNPKTITGIFRFVWSSHKTRTWSLSEDAPFSQSFKCLLPKVLQVYKDEYSVPPIY